MSTSIDHSDSTVASRWNRRTAEEFWIAHKEIPFFTRARNAIRDFKKTFPVFMKMDPALVNQLGKGSKEIVDRLDKYDKAVKVGSLSGERMEATRHQVFLDLANHMNCMERYVPEFFNIPSKK
ncbi:hypothetical protein N7456_005551 [Penicillium angulare]|uniref:Uncharacterized protein n=1 Tax=Penicillium angulare TaxID=116970 RepID=A0A9W9FYQ9_9EURO|nr:hypothetical protein N7456_005551 [Penicillium angulare]